MSAEADFLREEGYSDEEIAEALAPATTAARPPGGPWTREGVIEAVKGWAAENGGKPPSQVSWQLATDQHPTWSKAASVFGGLWSELIVAAGFPAPPSSGRRPKETRERDERRFQHSPPISGPTQRRPRDFGDVPRPGPGNPELTGLIDDITGGTDGHTGRDALPAPDTRHLVMSRGGKVLRLAEAMMRLQGGDWRSAAGTTRRTYAALAERVMEALELVEDDEGLIRAARQQERIERAEA